MTDSKIVTKSRGTILVADDEPMARNVVVEILRRHGYDCHESSTGPEAGGMLQAQEFDLLVADIQMPGNANLELVQWLSAASSGPAVLLVTGRPKIETAMQAVQLKAIGYLIKPIDAAELLRLVGSGVERQQIFRYLQNQRGRLETLLQTMRQLEEAERSFPKSGQSAVLGACLAMNIEQLLSSATDLHSLVEAIAGRSDTAATQRLAASRPFVIMDALRDAILVLERTKSSFKSRDLAELRQRLESLVVGSSRGA